MGMSYDPEILPIGIKPREMCTYVQVYHSRTICNSPKLKTSKCPEGLIHSDKHCELLITMYVINQNISSVGLFWIIDLPPIYSQLIHNSPSWNGSLLCLSLGICVCIYVIHTYTYMQIYVIEHMYVCTHNS